MTGFGRGMASSSGKKFTVDIKSLNSKQLDMVMRTPASLRELEVETRNRIAPLIERGKVEFAVNMESVGGELPVSINEGVVGSYKNQLQVLAATLGIPEPADWYSTLLRLPDAISSEVSSLEDEDVSAFNEAVDLAVEALNDFRNTEGKKLYAFFVGKIANIQTLLKEIDVYEADRVPKIQLRLKEQLSKLENIAFDAGRLEQEMIFYIEKLDVTEEKTRLKAHMAYFLETLGSDAERTDAPGQGKKLGFIAQEMGREINTLGSKSNHAGMQKIVVKMKDELEQIKEQVLNVL